MTTVFIDGSAGTTGLRIYDRLNTRKDLQLLTLSEDRRKDPDARKEAANRADIVFLCLPDDAARQSASFIENPDTVVIDTSTAHRTSDDWTYGFPELSGQAKKICAARRIANPGCHASGFIALVAPLVQSGLLAPDTPLTCFSLTGYSGGGKKMIAEYENGPDPLLTAPRAYGLSQQHKHLPEMRKVCGLEKEPFFTPIVAPFYSGMEVSVSLFDKEIADIKAVYADYYKETLSVNGKSVKSLVRFTDASDEAGFLSAAAFAGRDDMQISVYGNSERIHLVSRFDNLGKGASGAAIQNMNLVLGLAPETGLVI